MALSPVDWIVSPDPDQLKRINEQGNNIACWLRDASLIEDCLNTLPDVPVHKLDMLCTYNQAGGLLQKHLESIYGSQVVTCMQPLIEDVALLSKLFYEVTQSKTIRLYFALVDNDMCRRFHTDINDVRLLCTYKGPGTVCLKNSDVAESLLDEAMNNPELIPEDELFRAVTGHVLFLKGALHPNAGDKAVLHRSPVLSESREKRILLRLDTNTFSFQ